MALTAAVMRGAVGKRIGGALTVCLFFEPNALLTKSELRKSYRTQFLQ
jgi:hypothetical protein